MSRYPRFLATSIPGCPACCSFARRRHIYVSTIRRSGFPCTHTLRSNSYLPTTRCDSSMRTESRSYSRGVRSSGTPLNSTLNRFSFNESADSMFYLSSPGHILVTFRLSSDWLADNKLLRYRRTALLAQVQGRPRRIGAKPSYSFDLLAIRLMNRVANRQWLHRMALALNRQQPVRML